jgi:hypothetical protein
MPRALRKDRAPASGKPGLAVRTAPAPGRLGTAAAQAGIQLSWGISCSGPEQKAPLQLRGAKLGVCP